MKTAKLAIQAFVLTCPEEECEEVVANPITGSYSFVEGLGVPEHGRKLHCDAGHPVRMPKW